MSEPFLSGALRSLCVCAVGAPPIGWVPVAPRPIGSEAFTSNASNKNRSGVTWAREE
jgi:hypothetical protein